MCCSSPSTCAACACASTIRALRCSCRRAVRRRRGRRAVAQYGGRRACGRRPRILAIGEWCWRGTEHIMGWDIKDDGFGIVLSPELPALMRRALAPALHDFLDRNGFRLSDFDGFLFHPGGRKLLETMQQVLGLAREHLEHSWEVLRHLRQHVVGDGAVRARARAESRRARPASACGLRSGLFRLFRRGRSVMAFRPARSCSLTSPCSAWRNCGGRKQNEARLFAAGGIEYGRSHLPLMILFHAAWLLGLWVLGLRSSGRAGLSRAVRAAADRTILGSGHARAALDHPRHRRPRRKARRRGPYRFLRHPNYAIVIGEIAVVPLALGLPLYALVFSVLNAAVLAIRIPQRTRRCADTPDCTAMKAPCGGEGMPRSGFAARLARSWRLCYRPPKHDLSRREVCMSVDADTVRRVAHLARIAVAEDEVDDLQGELNAILAFVEQLARGRCRRASSR